MSPHRPFITQTCPEERRALDVSWQSTCPTCGAEPGFDCRSATGKPTPHHVARREIGVRAAWTP